MRNPLHVERSVPGVYTKATRAGSRDPVAWDAVMAHDYEEATRSLYDDDADVDSKPGLILVGDRASGLSSAAFIKLKKLRDDGCIIHHVTAVELSMLVRETTYPAISRYLSGVAPDSNMADNYAIVCRCRDDGDSKLELEKFRTWYPKVGKDPIFRAWLSSDGLLIKDVHSQKMTEAYGRALLEIVEKRTANGHALILTSHLPAQELYDKWKAECPTMKDTVFSIISRISERCFIVEFVKGGPLVSPPPLAAPDGSAHAEIPAAPLNASCVNVEPKSNQKDTDLEIQNRPETDPRSICTQSGRDNNLDRQDLYPEQDRTLREQMEGRFVHTPPIGPLF